MKKSIIPVAAFIAGMAIVPSVFAAENSITSYADWANNDGTDLASCLSASENKTCRLSDNASASVSNAEVTKDMTLDLQGHTLTFEAGYTPTNTFDIAEGASLTITNGTIINNSTSATNLANVGKKGSLIIDANIKTTKPIVAGEASKVVLMAGHTLEGDITVTGGSDTSAFGAGAATVEINGRMDGAYKQKDYVNGTINGSVSANGIAVDVEGKGTLTLNHATVSSDTLSPVVLRSEGAALTIENCSVLSAKTAAYGAMYIYNGANVASLTINNSTLKNTEGSVITGAGTIETVTINGSRFEAKADAKVKSGTTVFTHATYDGRVLGDDENVLADAEGTYGVDTVVCDAPAADDEENKGDDSENPNTADTIATYLTIATVALLGLGATAFVAKKSNR